ncbi:hypothetical protein F4778DRAFT_722913 [Xylariomycetidae sp. FL2044]|nr:hypothetical protein F4778DRAFT_722913 [Xylariomycetidae sp. FL2044]
MSASDDDKAHNDYPKQRDDDEDPAPPIPWTVPPGGTLSLAKFTEQFDAYQAWLSRRRRAARRRSMNTSGETFDTIPEEPRTGIWTGPTAAVGSGTNTPSALIEPPTSRVIPTICIERPSPSSSTENLEMHPLRQSPVDHTVLFIVRSIHQVPGDPRRPPDAHLHPKSDHAASSQSTVSPDGPCHGRVADSITENKRQETQDPPDDVSGTHTKNDNRKKKKDSSWGGV